MIIAVTFSHLLIVNVAKFNAGKWNLSAWRALNREKDLIIDYGPMNRTLGLFIARFLSLPAEAVANHGCCVEIISLHNELSSDYQSVT